MANIQNTSFLYQTFFDRDALKWLIPDNCVLLNMIDKKDGLSGSSIDHPFLYGPTQGYSIDFNEAMAQAANTAKGVNATLRCSQAYAAVEFYDKDRALSLGDNAYAELVTTVLKGKIMDFNNQLDVDCHASGTGWRGTVGAIAGQQNPLTGATLVPGEIYIATGMPLESIFNQDQLLQAVTYAGFPQQGSIFPPPDGRQPTTKSAAFNVQSVDASARTITLSDASAFVVGSFIVQAGGSIGFNSSNLYGGLIGMDAWVPYGGVSKNDNFCGVNRSIYPTRMAGVWRDFSRLSIEDAIKRGSAVLALGGARDTKVGLIHPLDFDALDSKLGSNVNYGSVSTATYGFDSIQINGASGTLSMVPDPHMPQGYVRLVDPSTWVFHHKYEIPHLVDVDGKQMEQGGNFDGRTARLRMYGQLVCNEPHKNGIFKIPAVSL